MRALIVASLSREGALFNNINDDERAMRVPQRGRETIRHRIRRAAVTPRGGTLQVEKVITLNARARAFVLARSRVAHRNRCKLPTESRTVY